jgi:hypothetical protein
MLVSRSRALSIRHEVSAWTRAGAGGMAQISCTFFHSRLSALSLATDRNWFWSTESAKPICGAA